MEIDAIRFEMFLHRLWAIGEEGRTTLQRVTASPIVAQGGESMSSFYDPEGTMVLACSGHLRFAAASSDAIKSLIQWFSHSPGIHEGDQFFLNDPYVAGSHTYDMMVIMPIFYQGELTAWVATSTHTADTGGLLRGGATEIYHEPRHAYTLGLLESVPRLDAREGRLVPIEGSPPDLTNLPDGCAFAPRCRFATDQCREERPELVEVAPDHLAACWHFDEVLVESREKAAAGAEA